MPTPEIVNVALAIKNRLDTVINDNTIIVEKAWKRRRDLGTVTGRKVDIYPTRFLDEGPSSRGHNFYDASFSIVTLERYDSNFPDAIIPDSWIEERVLFVEEKIFNVLIDARVQLIVGDRKYFPSTGEITDLCNMNFLDENSLFWSEVEVTFRTLARSPLV